MRQPYSNLLINVKPYTFEVDDNDSLRTKDYYYNLLFTELYDKLFNIKGVAYNKQIIGLEDRCQQILIYQLLRLIDLLLLYREDPTINLDCQIKYFKKKFNEYGFGINIVKLLSDIGVTYNPDATSNPNNYIQLEEDTGSGYILLE